MKRGEANNLKERETKESWRGSERSEIENNRLGVHWLINNNSGTERGMKEREVQRERYRERGREREAEREREKKRDRERSYEINYLTQVMKIK
jgi:hypothetical protein